VASHSKSSETKERDSPSQAITKIEPEEPQPCPHSNEHEAAVIGSVRSAGLRRYWAKRRTDADEDLGDWL
jgi:hypothetical protein